MIIKFFFWLIKTLKILENTLNFLDKTKDLLALENLLLQNFEKNDNMKNQFYQQ